MNKKNKKLLEALGKKASVIQLPTKEEREELLLTSEWVGKDGKKRKVVLAGDLNDGMVKEVKYYGFAGDLKGGKNG